MSRFEFHLNVNVFVSEHSSSSVGSDYYSQASPGSRSSVASETGSEDTCGGHVTERGDTCGGHVTERGDTCGGHVTGRTKSHSLLSATKSFTYPDIETTTSCSYFRSPKLHAKVSIMMICSCQFIIS